jgi:hypothetical protein
MPPLRVFEVRGPPPAARRPVPSEEPRRLPLLPAVEIVAGTAAMFLSFLAIKVWLLDHDHPHVEDDRSLWTVNAYLNLLAAGVTVDTLTQMLTVASRLLGRGVGRALLVLQAVAYLGVGASLGLMATLYEYMDVHANLTVHDDGHVNPYSVGSLLACLVVVALCKVVAFVDGAPVAASTTPRCYVLVLWGAWTTIAVGAGFGMGYVWIFPHD